MPGKTKIEWATDSWNPVTGCAKVSQGCKHCYAERMWPRLAGMPNNVYTGREFTDVKCHPERLDQPLRWKKPRRIFVNSMSDLFHEHVPDYFIDKVFAVMAQCPEHIFQILTKRSQRMVDYFSSPSRTGCISGQMIHMGHHSGHFAGPWPLENVWLGVSVEDQETADERIPLLLKTPAAVRWLSMEPLLSSVDLNYAADNGECNHEESYTEPDTNALICKECDFEIGVDWVVVGGESGPKARPMPPDWARSLRDQCQAADVPFFMKQMSKKAPIPDDLMIKEYPDADT